MPLCLGYLQDSHSVIFRTTKHVQKKALGDS